MTDIGTRVRSFDWSRTGLGPMAAWPPCLRAAVDIVLQSPIAMVLVWGADHVMVFNQAYAEIAGDRHPPMLGKAEPDFWNRNQAFLEAAFGGEACTARDQPVAVHRNGRPDEAWFDLSCSPVSGERSAVAGVLCTMVETTERVRLQRRQASEGDRLKAMFRQAPSFMAVTRGPDHVVELANDACMRLMGGRELVGKPAAEAFPELAGQGFVDLLDRVYRTGQRFAGRQIPALLPRASDGPPDDRFLEFLYSRIDAVDDGRPGVFVEGFDVTERIRAERRHLILFELDDRLRDLETPEQITDAASELLGRALGGTRAGFAMVDEDARYATIEREWTNGQVASAVGRYRLGEFGERFADRLRRGEIIAVADVTEDPMTAEGVVGFKRVDICALLNVPVLRSRRLAAIFYAHDTRPRAWSSDDVALLRDAAGRVVASIERAQARADSRASHAQFESLAEAVPLHVWTADAAGRLSWFNTRVYEYAGVAAGSLDDGGWRRLIHPEDLPGTIAAWTNAVSERSVYQAEYRLCDAGGEYRWVLARAMPVIADDGSVLRWVGTSTDIHDQKAAVARLAELNATLEERVAEQTRARERIWQVSQDLLVVADDHAVFLAVNPAWEAVLGWREGDLLGRTSRWLEHPDDVGRTDAERARLAAGDRTTSFQNRLRHRNGSYRWLSWTGSPDRGRLYCVARDVTEERTRQAELEHAQDALRQSQKMEAVGQLTGGIAHDFNNLLQGIIGSLDLVQKRITQGRVADVQRYMAGAMVSANRAAALTHRLLAFSRRQPLDPKAVNVNELVASMEDLLRRTMGERITIELALAGSLWLTLCDQNQLESALLNLAINARDAMPQGGKLTIETGNSRLDSAYVAVQREVDPGQYVCLCVTDTGAGMPPNVVERAFDPFFTTKPIGQGTGLGLSMIYGFARQSEGHAKIYSEVGQGTTVKIYLPRYRGAADADEEPLRLTREHHARQGETVLVVEDEPVVRRLVVDLLKDLGYHALEAADGPSGLEALQTPGRIDLLVTDIGLPGLNGRQIADTARRDRPDLKILFMTGYAETAALASGILDPGMAMITKPFAMEMLAARIRDMIRG